MNAAELTNQELIEWAKKPNHYLLDIRPIATYNGWALNNEPRGGHIRGAKTFPLSWTNYDEWEELLPRKDINPKDSIIVYGYNKDQAKTMVEKLAEIGYKDVKVFSGFMEWSMNSDLPMDNLPRYQQLIYPDWLKTLIDGGTPPTYKGNRYVVCHATYFYREDYDSGHIPGALHLDSVTLESPKDWNRRSTEEIQKTLLELGIDKDTTVILYGRFNHPNNEDPYPGRQAGQIAAMRCAHILMYAGVNDVRILNGGLASWIEAGYELTKEDHKPEPISDFGTEVPARPELFVDTPEAKDMLASDMAELVSIRSWKEFIGNVSGYHYIETPGRIPGAIFGNCGSDAYHMENYRNIDHTIREYHEVRDIWARDGITPDKHIAFYCGTGWRGSEAFFNAYFMGWPNISVYDGGWMEWVSDKSNPIATGIPEEEEIIAK